jgi:hypothetical protein
VRDAARCARRHVCVRNAVFVNIFAWVPNLAQYLSLGAIIDVFLIIFTHITTVRRVTKMLHGFPEKVLMLLCSTH